MMFSLDRFRAVRLGSTTFPGAGASIGLADNTLPSQGLAGGMPASRTVCLPPGRLAGTRFIPFGGSRPARDPFMFFSRSGARGRRARS